MTAVARPLIVACCLLLLAALTPDPASACSCMAPGPPCQEFWRADAVFTGRVTAVEPFSDREGEILTESGWVNASLISRRVTMTIIDAYRGVSGRSVTIYTGSGGGDCGYPFQVGDVYFVYATNYPRLTQEAPARTPRLYAGTCSRTAPLDRAADDVAYARSLAGEEPSGGVILGTVKRIEFDLAAARTAVPVPAAGIRVRVEGEGFVRQLVSDQDGRFAIGGLPEGSYTATALTSDRDFAIVYPSSKIELKNARGCAEVSVIVRSDGQILGRLVDTAGRGAPGVTLELVAPSRADDGTSLGGVSLDHRVLSEPDGVFRFQRVPPGDYLIAIHARRGVRGEMVYPRLLHPGVRETTAATAFHLGSGTRLSVPDFVLPEDYRLVTVSGIVLSPDGQPAAGAKVYVRSREGYAYLSVPAVTDEGGHFKVGLLAGQSFMLIAEWAAPGADRPSLARTELAIDAVGSGIAPVELRLARQVP